MCHLSKSRLVRSGVNGFIRVTGPVGVLNSELPVWTEHIPYLLLWQDIQMDGADSEIHAALWNLVSYLSQTGI